MLPHYWLETELDRLECEVSQLLDDRSYFEWLHAFLGLNASPVIRRECQQDSERALKDLARTRKQIDKLKAARAHLLAGIVVRKDFQA